MRPAAVILLLIPGAAFSHPCASCHPKEVEQYLQAGMGRSLRRAVAEVGGEFEHGRSATRFLIRSNQTGLFQRMQHAGENSDFWIEYVIGSGTHASCYLARVGDHLFQSPICYYANRGYDMAPGYEDNPAPGFTRPVTMECLLCHSGKPVPIPDSLNRYAEPAFTAEAISCERCHSDPSAHLKRPVRGSIVNPAKLAPAERDSVCERCHLSGAIRILNPGASLTDFRPGQRLEEVFTTYVAAAASGDPGSFTVVSQSEQLARSKCAAGSGGRMWCGACHDPHNQPASKVAWFRARCLSCHTQSFPASHPARTSDCLPCHMPKREAQDAPHTAFTDHRIMRIPSRENAPAPLDSLTAWREPAPRFRQRNFALALNNAGVRYSRVDLIARSYPLLLDAQKRFPEDPDILSATGAALMQRGEASAAAQTFERAIRLHPNDPAMEDSAGTAWMAAGDKAAAAKHFDRALALDPLLLPDIEALLRIYRETGDQAQEAALLKRVRDAMRTTPVRAPAEH